MIYWDTSALLKLYLAEPDSAYFLALAAGDEQILSSAIVQVEVLCALHRRELAGDLKAGGALAVFRRFTADVASGRIVLVPFGADVVAQAERLTGLVLLRARPVLPRSLDAIHVASAMACRAKALAATDARLRAAAAAVRLPLLPDGSS